MILFPAIANPQPREKRMWEKAMYYLSDILFVISIAAPYLITFALTRYEAGESSVFQRVVLLWLVMMQISCVPQRLVWNYLQTRLVPLAPNHLKWGLVFVMVSGAIWSIPGMIGFYQVFHLMINGNQDACDGYCKSKKIRSKFLTHIANSKQSKNSPRALELTRD